MDAVEGSGKTHEMANTAVCNATAAPAHSAVPPATLLTSPGAGKRTRVHATMHVHRFTGNVETFLGLALSLRYPPSWTVSLPLEKGAETSKPEEELVEGMTVAELLRAQGRLVGDSVHINIVTREPDPCKHMMYRSRRREFATEARLICCHSGYEYYIAPPDISDLLEALNTSRHPILLHGHRGGGRTTAAYFAGEYLQTKYELVKLTVFRQISSARDWWHRLAISLARSARELSASVDRCTGWVEFLELLITAPFKKPIALVIDDFDMVDDAKFASSQVRDAVRAEMKEFIAELHEHMPEQLACVMFIGTHNTRLQWQSSFTASNTIPVKDLTLRDIEDLVARFCEDYTNNYTVVDREVIEAIFEDTHGRAAFAVKLLAQLHDRHGLLGARHVTLELWKRHLRDAVLSVGGSLRTCLECLPGEARQLLKMAIFQDYLVATTPSQAKWAEELVARGFLKPAEPIDGFLKPAEPIDGYPRYQAECYAIKLFCRGLLNDINRNRDSAISRKEGYPSPEKGPLDLLAVVFAALRGMHHSGVRMRTTYAANKPAVKVGHLMEFYDVLRLWLVCGGYSVVPEMRFVGKHYVCCCEIGDRRGKHYLIELASVVLPGDAARHFARVSRNRKLLRAQEAVSLVFTCVDEVCHSLKQIHAHGWHSTADKRVKQVHVLHSDTLTESSAYLVNHRKHSIRKVPDAEVHS